MAVVDLEWLLAASGASPRIPTKLLLHVGTIAHKTNGDILIANDVRHAMIMSIPTSLGSILTSFDCLAKAATVTG